VVLLGLVGGWGSEPGGGRHGCVCMCVCRCACMRMLFLLTMPENSRSVAM